MDNGATSSGRTVARRELPGGAELGIYQSSEMQMKWSQSQHLPPTLVSVTLTSPLTAYLSQEKDKILRNLRAKTNKAALLLQWQGRIMEVAHKVAV